MHSGVLNLHTYGKGPGQVSSNGGTLDTLSGG